MYRSDYQGLHHDEQGCPGLASFLITTDNLMSCF